MGAVIYHNPKCSKSRQTLALLEERGVEATVVKYLEEPQTKAQLKAILKKLGKTPSEIIRFKETRANELGISKSDDRSEDEWIDLMVQNPILIERPIVVNGEKAAMGRPPEDVLAIL